MHSIASFKTISAPAEATYKEKGSKFISYCFPIVNEEQFKEKLTQLKAEHPNAVHHCYAFSIGSNRELYRYSDDGEPSGSAGKPIYGQLLSSEITNVAIIVVRYYGGINLGVGGLISAYKTAAKESIEEAEIIEKEEQFEFSIRYNYHETSEVERLLSKLRIEILEKTFKDDCSLKISANVSERASIIGQLNNWII